MSHDCMSPWPVGKYAKRSATLHIGSEDQLQYTNNQQAVTYLNPDVANPGPLTNLQPMTSGTGGGYTRMVFQHITTAQLNNGHHFTNANGPDLYVSGLTNTGSFVNVQPGLDYLVVTSGDIPLGTNTGSALAVGSRIPIQNKGSNGDNLTLSVNTDDIGGALNWQDARYNANHLGISGIDALDGADYLDTTLGSIAVTTVYLNLHNVGDIATGDTIAFSKGENANFVNNGNANQLSIGGNHWEHRTILTATRDVGNNRTTIQVLRLANTAPNVGPVASSIDGVSYTRNYVVRRNVRFDIRRPSLTNTGDTHVNFAVPIPNIIGYPEHKRCLLQVQQAWFYAGDQFSLLSKHGSTGSDQQTPPLVGVEILGVGPHNSFSTNVGRSQRQLVTDETAHPTGMGHATLVGYGMIEPIGIQRYVGAGNDTSRNQRIAYGFKNFRSILDDGVLCASPFGSVIRVRFVNMSTGETLASGTVNDGDATDITVLTIQENPTHLVLRLLFIDDDEVPMR